MDVPGDSPRICVKLRVARGSSETALESTTRPSCGPSLWISGFSVDHRFHPQNSSESQLVGQELVGSNEVGVRVPTSVGFFRYETRLKSEL
jgi:hypothetical protein